MTQKKEPLPKFAATQTTSLFTGEFSDQELIDYVQTAGNLLPAASQKRISISIPKTNMKAACRGSAAVFVVRELNKKYKEAHSKNPLKHEFKWFAASVVTQLEALGNSIPF